MEISHALSRKFNICLFQKLTWVRDICQALFFYVIQKFMFSFPCLKQKGEIFIRLCPATVYILHDLAAWWGSPFGLFKYFRRTAIEFLGKWLNQLDKLFYTFNHLIYQNTCHIEAKYIGTCLQTSFKKQILQGRYIWINTDVEHCMG